jgi:hypothetical protein
VPEMELPLEAELHDAITAHPSFFRRRTSDSGGQWSSDASRHLHPVTRTCCCWTSVGNCAWLR